MSKNTFKINEDKAEFIIFCTKLHTYHTLSIKISKNMMHHSTVVRVLGVTLDPYMTLERKINNVCICSYMQIRKINSIRRYLTEQVLKTLVQSTVTVGLDYCNGVYVNLPLKNPHTTTHTKFCSTTYIADTMSCTHKPILIHLDWLPICKRCQFKLLVMAYKALHQTIPRYITPLDHLKKGVHCEFYLNT